jgi:DNA-binding phage protein
MAGKEMEKYAINLQLLRDMQRSKKLASLCKKWLATHRRRNVAQLARASGVSHSAVSRLLRSDCYPSLNTVLSLLPIVGDETVPLILKIKIQHESDESLELEQFQSRKPVHGWHFIAQSAVMEMQD